MAQQLTLDLRKQVRDYMKLILDDGKVIEVRKPTKAIFNLFKPLSQAFTDLKSDDISETESWDLLDTIYEMSSKILSNNRKREDISVAYLEDMLATDDLEALFSMYMTFVNGHLEIAKN